MDPYIWTEAEVTYPGYVGTAQLDYKFTGESGFDLAGIDQDKWLVVGFELGGGEHRHDLHILAVDRAQIPDGEGTYWDRLMAAHGNIPVTDLLLHDVDPYQFLKSITHQFELRMRSRGAANYPIQVTSLGDVPEQK